MPFLVKYVGSAYKRAGIFFAQCYSNVSVIFYAYKIITLACFVLGVKR